MTHSHGSLVKKAGRMSSAGMLGGLVLFLSPRRLRASLPPHGQNSQTSFHGDAGLLTGQCRNCQTFSRLWLRTGSLSPTSAAFY